MKLYLRRHELRDTFKELGRSKPSPQARHIDINGHDVVEVTFTEEQANVVIQRAITKAKDAMKKVGMGFGKADPIKRNIVGFLGQVAWYIYAEDNFPEGLSTLKIGFQVDEYDFIYKRYKGDVKCAGKLDADLMMIPERYFQERRFDLYVGCRLTNEKPHIVQIWGYATRKEVEDKGYINDFGHGPTRCYRLKWLNPTIRLRDIPNKNLSKAITKAELNVDKSKQITLS